MKFIINLATNTHVILTENDLTYLEQFIHNFLDPNIEITVKPDTPLQFIGEQCGVMDWMELSTFTTFSVDINNYFVEFEL